MPTDRDLSLSDLFDAWAGAREYGSKHPDLAEHHTRRYAAFSKAFGVDLGEEPIDAPLGVIAANARFGAPIAERIGALRAELQSTAFELLSAVFPGSPAGASADEVRRGGRGC